MVNWTKIGLIFDAKNRYWWMQTHAQLPCSLFLGGDKYRLYFAGRDVDQKSHIGFVEISLSNPFEILSISEEPVLFPGPIGYFDEHGVYPSSVIQVGDKIYMFYIGWNKGCEPPLFYASIGLAISEDGGKTFVRHSSAPILSRSEFDPCLVTAPTVFKDPLLDRFIMIYTSGVEWKRDEQGKLYSRYHLKKATSNDCILWQRTGDRVIDFKDEHERDISRSSFLYLNGRAHLWYAFNNAFNPYSIGYAISDDLKKWDRLDDKAGISIGGSQYEDEMICYPHVIKHEEKIYMFYNGNRFGKDGILLATADVL